MIYFCSMFWQHSRDRVWAVFQWDIHWSCLSIQRVLQRQCSSSG